MKVLVVDDDVDLLDLMTYALRREGYNVLAAVDGQQALQRWEAENPDIVLLDGNLPKIDGFEVCRRIRHESKTPDHHAHGARRGRGHPARPADRRRRLHDQALQRQAARRAHEGRHAPLPDRPVSPARQRGARRRPGARPAVARGDQGRQARPAHAPRVPHPVHAGPERRPHHPLQPPDRVRLGLLRRGQLEPAQDPHLPHPQEAGADRRAASAASRPCSAWATASRAPSHLPHIRERGRRYRRPLFVFTEPFIRLRRRP